MRRPGGRLAAQNALVMLYCFILAPKIVPNAKIKRIDSNLATLAKVSSNESPILGDSHPLPSQRSPSSVSPSF